MEPLITVTSAQPPPPDLRSVKDVPAEGQSLIKKPPNSGHLQSTAKRPLRIVSMSNFTTVQKATLCKQIKGKMKKVYLRKFLLFTYFLKIIYF